MAFYQYQYRITIDPGFNTGAALWDQNEWEKLCKPVSTLVMRIPQRINAANDWAGKSDYMARRVHKLLCDLREQGVEVLGVFCEMPEFLESQKGMIAARENDLTVLAYLVGQMSGVCLIKGIPFTPVPVKQWIGQLPKDVVQQRIKKKLGVVYPNHAADAVGLGLYLKGFF